MSEIFYKVLPHNKILFYFLREQQMAEINELQKLYNLFVVAKGKLWNWNYDNSFKEWVSLFKKYPKKRREYQYRRFDIDNIVSEQEYNRIYNEAW